MGRLLPNETLPSNGAAQSTLPVEQQVALPASDAPAAGSGRQPAASGAAVGRQRPVGGGRGGGRRRHRRRRVGRRRDAARGAAAAASGATAVASASELPASTTRPFATRRHAGEHRQLEYGVRRGEEVGEVPTPGGGGGGAHGGGGGAR